ncbi:MAG: glycosyltransferase family 2 protein [Flavobacteriales bacterium]|nr:glycosyltransferase family 2 protein [Flavobacteriales bacterium]MDW8409555.1 glycosyltransferase family A protein [Flavobacteriales bacterium]
MSSTPLVSVLMPAFNAGPYISEAIQSILNQSCPDFELLVLDDGSQDNTQEIVLSYSDKRIRYLPNGKNLKLVATLNKGLDLAQGQFIARMDADDISLPQRFEKQIQFLHENPDVGCVGTGFRTLGLPQDYDVLYDHRPGMVQAQLLFDCKIAHATVMMRRSILDIYPIRYNPRYIHVEDFDFFHRLSLITRLCSIPEVLYLRRHHDSQVCYTERNHQVKIERILREKIFFSLFPKAFAREEDFHSFERYFVQRDQPENECEWAIALKQAEKIIFHPGITLYGAPYLNRMLARRCWDMCTGMRFPSLNIVKAYIQKGFMKWFNPGPQNIIKLILRGILSK